MLESVLANVTEQWCLRVFRAAWRPTSAARGRSLTAFNIVHAILSMYHTYINVYVWYKRRINSAAI